MLTYVLFDGDLPSPDSPVCVGVDYSDSDMGRERGELREGTRRWCEENLTAVPTLEWYWSGPAWNQGYYVFNLEFESDVDLIFFRMMWG